MFSPIEAREGHLKKRLQCHRVKQMI